MSNALKAARRFGMLANGFSKEVEDLRQIKSPFIVSWNFNHFVTVEGFGKNKVYLNDSAPGHRVVIDQEFDRAYTEVVLVMEPGPEFKKEGRPPSVINAITERLTGAMAAVAYCILVGFLLVIPGLMSPVFSQIFIDSILLERRADWLRPMILAMPVAALLQAALWFLQLRSIRRLKIVLSLNLSIRFMWHLLQLSAMFYTQRFSGEIANRSTLNDKFADGISGSQASLSRSGW